jgi:hypothetical protein
LHKSTTKCRRAAGVVGQAANAIGYGNAGSITNAVAVIPGTEVKQALGFATRGTPSAEVRKLIDVTSKYGSTVK